MKRISLLLITGVCLASATLVFAQHPKSEGNIEAWNRMRLGKARLQTGENTLRLTIEAVKGFQFDALVVLKQLRVAIRGK